MRYRWPSWYVMVLVYLCVVGCVPVSSDKSDSRLASTATRACFVYGCPNHPRDILYDYAARNALETLILDKDKANYDIHNDERKSSTTTIGALQELESCGDFDKVTMTLMGYKGGPLQNQINQDRSFVLSPFRLDLGSGNNMDCRILGVFDGHAEKGELVSQYAVEQVPQRLSTKLESYLTRHVMKNPEMMDKEIKRALVETFVEIDRDLPTKGQGGCTASVVLQLGSKIYVANTGDSQTFVAVHVPSSNLTKVVYVTREDKPDLPEERARIEEMGGAVNIPTDEEDSPRAIVTDPKTGWWYGIAMSRSIGDWDITGVIADPVVDVLDVEDIVASALTNQPSCRADKGSSYVSQVCTEPAAGNVNIFAVSATDGMMDYLDSNGIARSFAEAFYDSGDREIHPLAACQELIMQAANAWHNEYGRNYRDDIAVAACKLTTAEHGTAQ